ncbi:MAG: PP2C family protein-serine/threonine phosphatase, partial [Cyclobacteriaceae bacterium]|nr:PP2C family protein-serine/threonine phosphatase [Cyclobacteriaceae bacterium]
TFLRALTNILMVAIENKKLARQQLEQEAYRKEMEIAKKVQNFLFPKSLPNTPRLWIEAVYLPHQDVGGDYYDYIPLTESKFLLCIADVSGKGVPAALLMSNFQASLRTLVRKTHDLKEIIHELNHATYISSNAENFITVFIGIYDFETAGLEYANCGHNPSVLFHDNKMTILEEGTTVLGMFDPLPFIETCLLTDLDDFFFFGYTDGLTETFNASGDQFGFDALIAILETYRNGGMDNLFSFIFGALEDFRSELTYADDITMICCQVKNEP